MPGPVLSTAAVMLCAHGFPITIVPTVTNISMNSGAGNPVGDLTVMSFVCTCTSTPPTLGTPPCVSFTAVLKSGIVKYTSGAEACVRLTDLIIAAPSGLPVPPATSDPGNTPVFWQDLTPP